MISLKDKILNESILSTVGSGKQGLKEQIEEWLKRNNITQYDIDPESLEVKFMNEKVYLTEPIPDFMHVSAAKRIFVRSKEALKNLPKLIGGLYLENIEIDDFTDISDIKVMLTLGISECNIKSLKGFPTQGSSALKIVIGNNHQNIAKKDLKKVGVKINPNNIDNVGYVNFDYGCTVIGSLDQTYLEGELGKLSMLYKGLLPEMKNFNYSCKVNNTHVYFTIDFLSKEEHPHHISDNSIFIGFKYDTNGSVLELGNTGHLELTDEDRKGKYKYYALKGITAPYYDKGGKKFRACRLDQFTAKTIFDKTKDWLRDVIDAALEDQGGVLKRR